MMIDKTDLGKWVRLKGITGHGKNRIREHGDVWLVVAHTGNRVSLRSRNKTFIVGGVNHFDGRWIDLPTDKNFEVIGVDV